MEILSVEGDENMVVIAFGDDVERLQGNPDVVQKGLDELLSVVPFRR